MKPTGRAQAIFHALAAPFLSAPDASLGEGRGFTRGGLLVCGKFAAVPYDDGLLLKLPAYRVSELIASGRGLVFDAGKGRHMREWVVVPHGTDGNWRDVLDEAVAYARTV